MINYLKTLRKYWDDGEIVEILGVISLFGYLNRWNDSMGTPMEKGAIESGDKYSAVKRLGCGQTRLLKTSEIVGYSSLVFTIHAENTFR